MSTSYEPGPEGQKPGYWPPQQPKKSHAWLWITLVVVGVLAVCGIGGLFVLGSAGNSVVHTINEQESSQAGDVTITGCKLGSYGMGEVDYKILNHTDRRQDYIPEFDFRDKGGTTYGSATDIVNGLAPGKSYIGKAVGSYSEGATTCVLTGA